MQKDANRQVEKELMRSLRDREAREEMKRKRERRRKRSEQRKKRRRITLIITSIIFLLLAVAVGFGVYQLTKIVQPDHLEDGAVLLQEGAYEEAILKFEQVITESEAAEEPEAEVIKNIPEAYRGIALAKWELQDYVGCEEAWLTAIDNGAEQTGTMYHMLSSIAMQGERYDEVIDYTTTGLAIDEISDTQRKEMLFNQVVAYEKLLDWDNAKIAIEEYVLLYPDDAEAQKEAEFLRTR